MFHIFSLFAQRQKSRRGFTLIEVIVVIAITAILSSILISYSHRSRQQILLGVEKSKVAQTLLRAKALALAGFTKPAGNPPPCSYGFFIDYGANSYSLFEYKPPPPTTCDEILTVTSIDDSDPAYFHKTETSILDRDLSFGNGADRFGYIIFIPPDLKTLVFDESKNLFSAPMNIYLETKDGSLSSKIVVSHLTGQLSF